MHIRDTNFVIISKLLVVLKMKTTWETGLGYVLKFDGNFRYYRSKL